MVEYTLVFKKIVVNLYNDNNVYNIFDILLEKENKNMLYILNECRDIFKEGVMIQERLLDLYGRINYKIFNNMYVKDVDVSAKVGKKPSLSLTYRDKEEFFSLDKDELSDMEFFYTLGTFFGSINSEFF